MKKAYSVYFELYGKKMKTDVIATGLFDAQQQVLNKIKFHKVEEIPAKDNSIEAIDMMRKFFAVLCLVLFLTSCSFSYTYNPCNKHDRHKVAHPKPEPFLNR